MVPVNLQWIASPKPMLTQIVLVKLNGSHNRTKTHISGKGVGREEEGLMGGGGDESSQNMSYTWMELLNDIINKNYLSYLYMLSLTM